MDVYGIAAGTKDCYFSARMNVLLYTDIGRSEMCEAERIWIEEIKDKVEADALKRGREEVMRDIVHSMITQKFDDSIITYTTGMPLARIQAMRHEMQLS